MKLENKTIQITTSKGIKEMNKLLLQGWEIAEQTEYEVKLFRWVKVKKRQKRMQFV